jgi:hypothetical protein
MRIRNMEDDQRIYNHEEEVKCLNISLGNKETKLNGHRSRANRDHGEFKSGRAELQS